MDNRESPTQKEAPRQNAANIIPPITDPLGKYWNQPLREAIELTEERAWMPDRDFKGLAEYSTTLPTGTYTGKMWKRRIPWEGEPFRWFLCWYGAIEGKEILIHNREIILSLTGCSAHASRASSKTPPSSSAALPVKDKQNSGEQ